MHRITLGQPFPPPSDNPIFDGPVHMREYFADRDEAGELNVAEVTFRPQGRTRWHSHDGDQLLVVTGGYGIIANERERIEVRTGDVVLVSAGERHWHGPQPGAEFTHISVLLGGADQIFEPVQE
jgi:quercetin dioxygenase-like cupin family protein